MASALTAPRFVKAKSPKGLERAMLQNNIKRARQHVYTIVWDGKDWFGWYYVELDGAYNTEIKEILSEG